MPTNCSSQLRPCTQQPSCRDCTNTQYEVLDEHKSIQAIYVNSRGIHYVNWFVKYDFSAAVYLG